MQCILIITKLYILEETYTHFVHMPRLFYCFVSYLLNFFSIFLFICFLLFSFVFCFFVWKFGPYDDFVNAIIARVFLHRNVLWVILWFHHTVLWFLPAKRKRKIGQRMKTALWLVSSMKSKYENYFEVIHCNRISLFIFFLSLENI